MTTITTYAELKQNILDYTKRTGEDMLSKLDQFIDSAEQDIGEFLQVREMEVRATASTSTSDRFLELPTGFIKMRQLQITVDSVLYNVDMVPLKRMIIQDTSGIPYQFSVTSQVEFNRTSDQAYTVEMDYLRELTALSSSNTTNDILTNYPNVYLSACLKYAFLWTMQYDLASYWENQFDKHVSKANRKSRKGRVGPSPSIYTSGMIV